MSSYDTGEKRNFSFKSVGVQAQGRTTVLKINYRNTQEILEFAARFAKELLTPADAEEDGVPRLLPISGGQRGPKPLLIKLPTLKDEASYIIEQFKAAHRDGTAWKDMAILYRNWNPVGRLGAQWGMWWFIVRARSLRTGWISRLPDDATDSWRWGSSEPFVICGAGIESSQLGSGLSNGVR